MIIKEFRAKTENEAIEAAKKALGNNIVIMHSKQVKRKGILSFFKSPMVEITVGLEEESERNAANTTGSNASARSITEALVKIGPIVEKAESEGKIASTRKETEEERLDNLQNLIESKMPAKTLADKITETETKKPEKEVREEKPKKPEKVEKTEKAEKADESEKKDKDDELNVFFELLRTTMDENEVRAEYIEQIMEETEKTTKAGTPFDAALAGIYQKMILKFGKPSTITASDKGPKVVFFIGPTGVGKTTTIAKIASKFSVESRKKIALLTADTYRIAAAEQLRTYASILEVPFRIIYTKEEMENSLNDFKEFDFIFVDTAGHSHQNNEQKEVMGEFLHCLDGLAETEIYLVVSATTKYRDLISIADAYTAITDYKLIFTKLDETTALGNLLNLRLYTDAPLSYVTCGQNVPDDIEDFNAQHTVKNLLGGKR
ncbi:MAG: flagellar biosynthesis protein FlhF [Lachnospiraceae bacterium]|nr:flagellar biosynthesis protein FlhF [Lachnospiraceae bacterium]